MTDVVVFDTITLHADCNVYEERPPKEEKGTSGEPGSKPSIDASSVDWQDYSGLDWSRLNFSTIDFDNLDKVILGKYPASSIPVVDSVLLTALGKWAKDFLKSANPLDPSNIGANLAAASDFGNYLAAQAIKFAGVDDGGASSAKRPAPPSVNAAHR